MIQGTSILELSRHAVETNVRFIRNLLNKSTFSAVIKGDAYGHGIAHFSPELYRNGVRHFCVFSANEAYELSLVVPDDISIIIMGYLDSEQVAWAIENGYEFFVFHEKRIQEALAAAKRTNKRAGLHLEIETGMNRTGFKPEELEPVLTQIMDNPEYLKLSGVCSHLAGAENISNDGRIREQIAVFNKVKKRITNYFKFKPIYHLACSAASIQYPETQLDLSRIGILQYGFFPSEEILVKYLSHHPGNNNPLKRVITWKTRVIDTKTVKAGEYIGYGENFYTNTPTKIAVIPVGYSHGFARSLSNLGKVLIRGQRFGVIGTVNMNMTIIDITEHPEIENGDEVILIGRQGELEISVSSFSAFSELVNYELLTRLPANIPRTWVD